MRDEIDFLASIKTVWCNNLPGAGHELVNTGYLRHMCWVSKSWWFGLGSVVFRGWLGNFRIIIFSNPIETVWCENLPGAVHELVSIGHLDHLCWFLKYWWDRLGRVGLGLWLVDFRNYTFINIITADKSFPLDEVTILVRWCKGHKESRK